MARTLPPLLRRAGTATLGLTLAAALWVPLVHHLFDHSADPRGRRRTGDALLATQLALHDDPEARTAARGRMRTANAEWDFMGRTFTVLALANRALEAETPSERSRLVAVIDDLIDDTLELEAERGQHHFLMSYSRARPFLDVSGRSVFVDGEVALMLASLGSS